MLSGFIKFARKIILFCSQEAASGLGIGDISGQPED